MGERVDSRIVGGSLVWCWSLAREVIGRRSWPGDCLRRLRRFGCHNVCLLDVVARVFEASLGGPFPCL
ncbi:hypothetical protein RISK_001050 [Rhodopirellula islandica]|uniref:Uncharacterized protein n=1 Tax=Rhodopirellula islandica TaxID=595434 RepID=A0A0J1EP33_RHOIS|nr:hypothetical protein RISK_001050 [Rhodopirellula islandica]